MDEEASKLKTNVARRKFVVSPAMTSQLEKIFDKTLQKGISAAELRRLVYRSWMAKRRYAASLSSR
jgi:hypothetical protein